MSGTLYMCHLVESQRTQDSWIFQYKLLNNVFYLNKMLFRFSKVDSCLCSFCKTVDETPHHLFYSCTKAKLLQDQSLRRLKDVTLWMTVWDVFKKLSTLIWMGFLGVRFVVGGGWGWCWLKLVRIVLETWNVICKYTYICSFRKNTF